MKKKLDKFFFFCYSYAMFLGGKSTIGLDIGSGYLKVVQLKDTKGGYELEFFDILPLPPELIVDGSVIDSLRLVDSLKELTRKAKIRTKDVVISMRQVILRLS